VTESFGQESRTFKYTYHLRGWLERVEEVMADQNGNEHTSVLGSYSYDGNGNRLSNGAVYDWQDRLREDNEYVYAHDRNGALTQKIAKSDGALTTYDHDAFGRLVGVTLPDGTNITYQLDPLGRRVAKYKDGAVQWTALYRGKHQLVQLRQPVDGGSDLVTRFVYGLGRNVPDYMVRGSDTYRILTDMRGSVRLVVDAGQGLEPQRVDYDAWGNVIEPDSPERNLGFQPFGYAGGLYDEDTGLVHFGSRDYDPKTGRWTSKDPLGFDSGSTNLYLYANGDPVNYADPGGQIAWAPIVLFAMAGSAPFLVPHSDAGGEMVAMGMTGLLAGDLAALGTGLLRVGGAMARDLAGSGLRCAMRGTCRFTTRYLNIRVCFAGDTPVSTADGPQPISELAPGDMVWARDDVTGRTELRPVKQVFVTPDRPVLALVVEHGDGTTEVIRATEDHPFATPSGGWVTARMLQPGDQLVTAGAVDARVLGGWTESGTHSVYNLEVEGMHTYFVGDAGVWVHNICTEDDALLLAPEEAAIREVGARSAGTAARPKHHVFPQEEREFFELRGFTEERSIDRYTIELDEATHQAIHGGGDWRLGRTWDGEWNSQIVARIGRQERRLGRQLVFGEVMKVGGNMTRDYGLGGINWIPYR
jgi:RHS repeat-associated protein